MLGAAWTQSAPSLPREHSAALLVADRQAGLKARNCEEVASKTLRLQCRLIRLV